MQFFHFFVVKGKDILILQMVFTHAMGLKWTFYVNATRFDSSYCTAVPSMAIESESFQWAITELHCREWAERHSDAHASVFASLEATNRPAVGN